MMFDVGRNVLVMRVRRSQFRDMGMRLRIIPIQNSQIVPAFITVAFERYRSILSCQTLTHNQLVAGGKGKCTSDRCLQSATPYNHQRGNLN